MIRTALALLVAAVVTPVLASMVVIASLLGVRDRAGTIYDWAPRLWARSLLWVAGVKVIVHNPERLQGGAPHVFVANHVSWFDVFVLAALLPRYKFVAKAELFRLPIFGKAALAAGMIPIQRENRKSAFASYDVAATRIREGASVVVYPEGTRGREYALRSFKKGPFVLATSAQVPIVPTVLFGTMHVQNRDSIRVRSGTVHLHLLEPIETAGTTYEDRERLSEECWRRMAEALQREYGVEPRPVGRATSRREV